MSYGSGTSLDRANPLKASTKTDKRKSGQLADLG